MRGAELSNSALKEFCLFKRHLKHSAAMCLSRKGSACSLNKTVDSLKCPPNEEEPVPVKINIFCISNGSKPEC